MNAFRLLCIISVVAALMFSPSITPQVQAGWCDPWQTCDSDGDCDQGVCINTVCHCGPEEGRPICGDSCPDRGLCYPGACGGTTVHIDDCRGIASGAGGGVISYCDEPACAWNYGESCSASNSCGMTNYGTIQCDGSCDASPPPEALCGVPPIGAHEAADCTSASGWTFDPDYAGSTSVQIYRDGPVGGGGVLVATVTANQSRPDIGVLYPGHTNSGWSWTIPAALKNGVPHPLYAYGINVNSSGTPTSGPHPLLGGSPQSITCTDPPTGAITGATCTTATGNAMDPQGTPVTIRIYNGIAGSGGVLIGSGTANPSFSVPITPPLDMAPHTLYAYGQDIPAGTWHQLSGSASVTCAPTTPPIVTITQIDRPDYCSSGPEGIVTWQYSSPPGLAQKNWQLQVAANPGFAPTTYDSGKMNGATTTASTGQGILDFNQTYWTRVKVWDIADNESAWSGSGSFTTPPGPYPAASFTVNPSPPIAKQEATFTDTSDYASGTPTLREWDFGDGSTESPGSSPTTHTYADALSGITITLRVASTNSGADFCTATKNFNVAKPIPTYKEVLPR